MTALMSAYDDHDAKREKHGARQLARRVTHVAG
jgi:hypothetical protein